MQKEQKTQIEGDRAERQQRMTSLFAELQRSAPEGEAAQTLEELLALKKEELQDVEGQQQHAVPYRESGWKERYYCSKFKAANAPAVWPTVAAAAKSYAQGLVWMIRYYTQVCVCVCVCVRVCVSECLFFLFFERRLADVFFYPFFF